MTLSYHVAATTPTTKAISPAPTMIMMQKNLS